MIIIFLYKSNFNILKMKRKKIKEWYLKIKSLSNKNFLNFIISYFLLNKHLLVESFTYQCIKQL